MKNNNKRVDMLNGSLLDKLLLFAIPLALSSILQQLFNAVDVAVVGKFDSSSGQAAVGCNGPVINLLINIFILSRIISIYTKRCTILYYFYI